jgi:uncharacterized protein (TIGR02145 family)
MKTLSSNLFRFLMVSFVGLLFALPYSLVAQQESTFKDPRDNQVYQVTKIGKKTWMAENLKFKVEEGSWIYNSDTANLRSFGRLYDYTTAMTACPKGWVLPTEQDWGAMMMVLGGRDLAGAKLMEMDSTNQKIIKKVDNGKSLSTLLGGIRHADGTFSGIGLWGGFWSATVTAEGVKNFLFAHGDKGIGISTNDKGVGFLVRCIKK